VYQKDNVGTFLDQRTFSRRSDATKVGSKWYERGEHGETEYLNNSLQRLADRRQDSVAG